MPDYIWNSIICFAIFWVGFKAGKMYAIVKIAKEVADQINSINSDSVQLLTIEKHEQLYFAYNEEHKFLAQGSNFVELLTNLKSRFPGQDFKIVKEQEGLTEEESGRMVKAIFEVFGERKSAEEQV